jgi:hypothetical protein
MSIINYAKNELNVIGMLNSTDEMNVSMANHILHMVEEFSKEGHSGFSASYAISILEKLLRYQPLCPLTGDDSEWVEVMNGVYQNTRCFRVFKENGQAYDSEGTIFYDIVKDDNGKEFKVCFTSSESRKVIEFPYTPTQEYRQRPE